MSQISIDKQAFAKDEFFHGKYNTSPFTLTELRDIESGVSERVISWLVTIPINKEEAEREIIEQFNKN